MENYNMIYDIDTDNDVKKFLENNPTIRLEIIKEITGRDDFRIKSLTDFTFKEKIEFFICAQQHIHFKDNETLKNYLENIITEYKTLINNLDNYSLTSQGVNFLIFLLKQSILPAYTKFCQIIHHLGFRQINVIYCDDDDDSDDDSDDDDVNDKNQNGV